MRYTCIEINDNALELPSDEGYRRRFIALRFAHDCCFFWGDDSPSPRGAPQDRRGYRARLCCAVVLTGAWWRGRAGKESKKLPRETCGGQCNELSTVSDRERAGRGLLRQLRCPAGGGRAGRRAWFWLRVAGNGHAARLRGPERAG